MGRISTNFIPSLWESFGDGNVYDGGYVSQCKCWPFFSNNTVSSTLLCFAASTVHITHAVRSCCSMPPSSCICQSIIALLLLHLVFFLSCVHLFLHLLLQTLATILLEIWLGHAHQQTGEVHLSLICTIRSQSGCVKNSTFRWLTPMTLLESCGTELFIGAISMILVATWRHCIFLIEFFHSREDRACSIYMCRMSW